MAATLNLALVGDYRASAVAHQAIPLAIERAAKHLNINVHYSWLPTDELADLSAVRNSDAVWVVPGSPYKNDDAVFATLR